MPASKALPPFKSTSNAAALVNGWPAETAPFGPATVGRSAARGNSAVGPAITNAAVKAAAARRRRAPAIVSMTAEMIAQATADRQGGPAHWCQCSLTPDHAVANQDVARRIHGEPAHPSMPHVLCMGSLNSLIEKPDTR